MTANTEENPPKNFHTKLPHSLSEPYYYLSSLQAQECHSLQPGTLKTYAKHLPGWVPHRVVAESLGYSNQGIDLAIEHVDGAYVWATEFENVHVQWEYVEPSVVVEEKTYVSAESFYQSQKPVPYDDVKWKRVRVDVMRRAIRAKFASCSKARELLISSHPHPLLSIKRDSFWGFDSERGGENQLAKLLMELRDELISKKKKKKTSPSLSSLLTETPTFVICGPANDTDTEKISSLLWSAILPHLPPLVQQHMASGSKADTYLIKSSLLERVYDEREGRGLRIGESRYSLSDVQGMHESGDLEARIVDAFKKSRDKANNNNPRGEEDEDASESHSVLQRNLGAVMQSQTSTLSIVKTYIIYKDNKHTVYTPPHIPGLMFKSKVLSSLGLNGGFQDYYMRLNGSAFGSRTPLQAHASFRDGCVVVLEDVGGRPKPVGMT